MPNHQHQGRIPQEIQPQKDEGRREKDVYGINNPHVFSPTNILRLQRTIGNQAVRRLSRGATSSRLQREAVNHDDAFAVFGRHPLHDLHELGKAQITDFAPHSCFIPSIFRSSNTRTSYCLQS